jgi:hypothetical protein
LAESLCISLWFIVLTTLLSIFGHIEIDLTFYLDSSKVLQDLIKTAIDLELSDGIAVAESGE